MNYIHFPRDLTYLHKAMLGALVFLMLGCNQRENNNDLMEYNVRESYPDNVLPSQQLIQNLPLEALTDSIIHLYSTGDYQHAMDYILVAHDKAIAEKNEEILARVLNLQGLVHWRLENYTDALTAYQESAKIAENIQLHRLVGLTHTNRGLIYKSEKNFEIALYHNNKAIAIFTEQGFHRDLAIALNNQGQIFKNQGKNDIAETYYLKALDNYNKVDYKNGVSATYYNLSEIYMRQGLKEASLDAAYLSLSLGMDIESKVRIGDAYLRLSESYEHFNELDSSLKYFKLHYDLTKDLQLVHQSGILARQQAKMGAEVKNLQIQNLEKEKELAANKLWLIIISIFTGVGIAAFFLYRYLSKLRFKKRKLEHDLRTSKKILDIKEQELKTYILDLTEKNIQLNKLKDSLYQGVSEKQIKDADVSKLLEQKILTEEDWEIFKIKFNAIYPGFFSLMKKIKTPLTEAEIRFMVLFRLELSGKEMAKILGISPQSVRVCKLRLKKKLQKEGYQTVEEFLQLLII